MRTCKLCKQTAIWVVIPFKDNKALMGDMYFECSAHFPVGNVPVHLGKAN